MATPPLKSLQVFEAAARHLSFTKAAEELNVTQAAVSHQVKQLEERLGFPLFRRLNRALMLTDAGQALYPDLNQALGLISSALRRVGDQDRSGRLTLSTMDSFAATWLMPRLSHFRQAHPEIDLRVHTSDHPIDFDREEIDFAIRYGEGTWPGLLAERLMKEELFPVCAPSLLESGPPLATPHDLRHHTLLHDSMREDWRMWLLAAGVDNVDPDRGPGYHHSNLVLQAAEQGDGVALARSVLVERHLSSGRLVKPFDMSLPVDFAYYFVCPPLYLKRPKVRAFHDWIFKEIETP